MTDVQAKPAELMYAAELEALAACDKGKRPQGWRLSPGAALEFIMGGKAGDTEITPKYIGDRRLVELAVATLLTDRALLLLGEPGTAKSRLSECLAAAVSGDSGKLIQGTAGTSEEQIRYGWNYAMLISHGPSPDALIKSPLMRAMESGSAARFEELTRCPPEVQDSLISILSERSMAIPELGVSLPARRGFSLIATANLRDRGVFAMSSALQRRFNMVVLPPPPDLETEIDIVTRRVTELSGESSLGAANPDRNAVERVVRIFRELRAGETLDGSQKLRSPEGGLSAADEISALMSGMALSESFRGGKMEAGDMALGLQGVIVRDGAADRAAWIEYIENVMKKRGSEWSELYSACRDLNP